MLQEIRTAWREAGKPDSRPRRSPLRPLNANVVLRWEWRLGSLLYVVYQRAQVPNVKLSYWWG
jgi:hypothetical protein